MRGNLKSNHALQRSTMLEITYRSAGADLSGSLCRYKHIAPLEQRRLPLHPLDLDKVYQLMYKIVQTIVK